MSGDNKELFEIEEKSLSENNLKEFLSMLDDYINKANILNSQRINEIYVLFCQSSTIKEQIESEIQKLNLPYTFEYIIYPHIDNDKIYLFKKPEKPIKKEKPKRVKHVGVAIEAMTFSFNIKR